MRSRTLVQAILAAATLAGGCSHAPRQRSATTTSEVPPASMPHLLAAATAPVVRGELAVVRLDPAWNIQTEKLRSALLPNGRSMPVAVVAAGPARSMGLPGWITDFGPWSVRPTTPGKTPAVGVQLLTFNVSGEFPQSLKVGESTIQLQWLEPAPLAPQRAEASPDAAHQAALQAMLAPEAACPLTRWRARLAGADIAQFDDPILEAWASSIEAAAFAGCAKLQQADPLIRLNFERRVAGVVRFPGGVRAPLWPAADAMLLDLLTELALDSTTPAHAELLVRDYLGMLPPAAAWVRDDAAGIGALAAKDTPAILSAVDTVNLSEKAAVATFTTPDAPHLSRLDPMEVNERLVPFARSTDGPRVLPTLTIGLNQWEIAYRVAATGVPVQPPGLAIGPLVPDWTMLELGSCAENALVQRSRGDLRISLTYRAEANTASGPDDPSGWVLLAASTEQDCSKESISLFLGPRAEPVGLITVGPDGANRSSGFGASAQLKVARLSPGWTCEIMLPHGCIDSRGFLWLGLTFQDHVRGRLSWPRAQLPWQTEPGRVIVDTHSWGGLEAPQPSGQQRSPR